MPLKDPILVSGGGIAGLTAALCLARRGHAVEVFEAAERLLPIGAGIQLSPNALRVLFGLGLRRALEKAGTAAHDVILRSARSGRLLARVPVEASDRTGYLAIRRADLQDALLDAVGGEPRIALHLGQRVERAWLDEGKPRIELRSAFSGIFVRGAPLLVAADGVRSPVAASLGLPPARASGTVALRFAVAASRVADPPAGIEAWLGPRQHAVAYPVDGGREINLVLILPEELAHVGSDTRQAAGQAIADWDRRLRVMIEASEPRGLWPLMTTEDDRPLVHGGAICLLGDAGHAMLPYAAQGAAMAIEDAAVLAAALDASPSIPVALDRFSANRLPRLKHVRARVRFHDLVYHLPHPLSFGRDLVLSRRSPGSLRRNLAWLYDWRAP